MEEAPSLQIQAIAKTYPGVQALKGVSFEVRRGHVHALVGENGAGKSTLIKILAGAEPPDPGGRLWVEGQPYAPRSPKDALAAGISTIYQAFGLLPDRTIMHNILLGKEPSHRGVLDFQAMRSQAAHVLYELGAAHLDPEVTVARLKVGEKQIVEIAKALVNESRILVMDEPTAALNQTEAAKLFESIRRLRASCVTILYVSHRLDEIFDLADTVTVLRDGEHISTRPIQDVTRDSLIEEMIGRKLSSVFPKRIRQGGEEVLKVERLSSGTVLTDVSFSLHRGEILAVTGLSGSGKTELGKAVFGDLPIDQGTIHLKGRLLKHQPSHAIRNKMMYLPEDRKTDGIFWEQSVRRNIAVSVLPQIANKLGFIGPARERQVAQVQVDALDIRIADLEQTVTSLSGGNQQKVSLGRCLALEPEVFILMEPTQGIDVGVKFEIYQFVTRQAALGKSILLISSELPEILGLAHRVLVMRESRIVAELDCKQTNQEEILRYALGKVTSLGSDD